MLALSASFGVEAQTTNNGNANKTPLLLAEVALLRSPPEVQYEFMRLAFSSFKSSFSSFLKINIEERDQLVQQGYYIHALSKCLLIADEKELADLLNTYKGDGNEKELALEFEQIYKRIRGVYPDVIPVDVNALTRRMLDKRTIR